MALGKGLQSLIPQQKRQSIHKETGTATADRVWHIPLSEITPNTEQPRKQFDHQDLEDLVASIKEHGILQPIVVTETTGGGYELIAGERRYRAAQIAGLPTVPAMVRQASQKEKLELALIENIQRQNLNPIEEAFAYRRLIDEFHLTQEAAAARVGKNRSTVANMLRLLDLPEVIQKALIDGQISTGKAKALLSLREPREQLAVFASMTGSSATTVRDVESLVAKKGTQSRKGLVRRDPNVRAQEELMEERLGSRVHIAQKGDKGTITIFYHSQEELKRLLGELT